MNRLLKNWPQMVVVFVRGFHQFFSFGACCRFEPTCSQYSSLALKKHGLVVGSLLSIKRLLKCHPMGSFGSDPVVDKVG